MAQRDATDPAARGSLVGLRPATAEDEPFLYALYASTRAEELALLNWDEAQKSAFVQMQFTAQHRYYHEHFADAAFQVIECDGVPIGRLYVVRWPDEIRVIDIGLLPSYRNRGIGSWLLEQVLADAADAGKHVSIHVERTNPALGLYTRLGFTLKEDLGVYLLLDWSAAQVNTAS